MAAHQAPPPLGFSRQEQWSGWPFPSLMHESEKWKWSRSVESDSQLPHGLQPTRLLRPWDFPGKSTGVGCHCLRRCFLIGRCIFFLLIFFPYPWFSVILIRYASVWFLWHLLCLVFSELLICGCDIYNLLRGNSQSLLFQIFIASPFSFWYTHYVYFTPFVVVPHP